jgi:hypothetical protein
MPMGTNELSNAEDEQLETGEIEVFWESLEGQEFSTQESVQSIAQSALDRIDALEHALTHVMQLAERESHFGGPRKDIVARAYRKFIDITGYCEVTT